MNAKAFWATTAASSGEASAALAFAHQGFEDFSREADTSLRTLELRSQGSSRQKI